MAGMRVVLVALHLAASTLLAPVTSFASDGAPLREAPDFTHADLEGNQFRLSSYRGKLVLLNFWATWCAPCLAEIPKFVAWQRKYGAAGLQIVGVSMDDTATPVKRAYEKHHLNYPVVMGDAHLGERFGGVLGLPLSYLIDPQGRIVARYQGELNLKQLEAQIKSLLPRS
jgi:cytochrome c biogenesis protein CcmG, thiol:disulfide interchange protein DsbE